MATGPSPRADLKLPESGSTHRIHDFRLVEPMIGKWMVENGRARVLWVLSYVSSTGYPTVPTSSAGLPHTDGDAVQKVAESGKGLSRRRKATAHISKGHKRYKIEDLYEESMYGMTHLKLLGIVGAHRCCRI